MIGGGQIDGVIALAHVERAAVDSDAVDGQRNQRIRIGVAVTVRVGGQIVGIQKVADLEVLRNGLAMVAGDSGSEILRRLDASRGGFDGKARNGDRRARAAGIGVEHLVMNDDALRRDRASATTVPMPPP